MLNGLLAMIPIIAVILTGLWFVHSRNEDLYDKLVYAVGGIGFVISLCFASYIAGAKSTFKALQESPDYQLPEWFEIAPDGITSIIVVGVLCLIGLSSFFSALKKPSKET